MVELKREEVKRDTTLDELIRIDYSAVKNYAKKQKVVDDLMTQIRLYKKNWEKIFS